MTWTADPYQGQTFHSTPTSPHLKDRRHRYTPDASGPNPSRSSPPFQYTLFSKHHLPTLFRTPSILIRDPRALNPKQKRSSESKSPSNKPPLVPEPFHPFPLTLPHVSKRHSPSYPVL
ncbi:uncharacterized protein K444DRAFT_621231 [Hyaloscypha bicolor E]|uniref:Uncharacterized protein n=1 Tax=Hyaloscypha bicolor E TaxID=1095630 RepID=A0A2J6SMV4_9HELO|nr:uncharacterized protein K444DRAFT_621231 [Hyaloscypha bicolor E]PMD52095.1 hypothetical protein K444DRAFT_621231 [Hyaloscypha bicolor E]